MKAKLTEKEFMAQVRQLAHLWGWRTYHTHDSSRSDEGFPDLVFVKCRRPGHPTPRRAFYAELKTAKGKLRPEQNEWICDLRAAGEEVYIWRPSDWPEIERVLKRE
jgi:hypothetical protein